MCQCLWLLYCALLGYLVIFVSCFNIESKNYAVYGASKGGSQSMFGFTVALHRERNRGWLLVGAPEGTSRNQPIKRGGVVFKCLIDRDDACEEVPFDQKGNNLSNFADIDEKDGQWFGATLSTSGKHNGPIVACAPRYVWYASSRKRRDPVGTCYVSNGYFTEFEEYSPCRTSQWGYHRQGSCQAGFSAAINSEGDRLFMGAPGSWYWQGQMYSIDAHARFPFTPGIFSGFGGKGQVFQQSTETRPAVFSTKEGTAKDDDSYLGYSTIVGDFDGSGEQGIAVGMPRGADLHGKVLLYTWELTNFKNFSSDQLGSYFGYCLATSDIDGDNKTDIIVGAPMYTLPNNEGSYEVGRVYVIYQASRYGTFSASYAIDGFKSKSRFGHALAALGDINQDGYGDFAVGAPYDGPMEKGAIYIYHGSEKGIRKTYSQAIFAEDLSVPFPSVIPIETFGFSISGGIDLDGNDYPDFGVGAYLSNNAFFFRSRPVVRVEASVNFLTPNKQIDLKKTNCRLRDGTLATCTDIDFCVRYTGKGIPDSINLDVQYILDTKKLNSPRMAFIDAEDANSLNDTIRLLKDKTDTCATKKIYIKSSLYDKLTSLEAEVKYWMRNESENSYFVRNPRSKLFPILDLNSPPVKKDSISIERNCSRSNICIPNLTLNIKPNVEKYLFGSNENLNFTVIVANTGEDSFETTFQFKYPEGIYFKKIVDDASESHILCSTLDNRTVSCEVGNPLGAGKIAKFELLLQPYYKEGMKDKFEFDFYVNSTNPEDKWNLQDNHQHVSIKIWADSEIELRGVSHPPELQFNESLLENTFIRKEGDIGPQVTHVYFLRNLGPAIIEETEILLVWPHATLESEDFLYLLEQPHTLGNVHCDIAPANYRNITVDHNFSWKRINVNPEAAEFTYTLTGGGVTSETGTAITGIVGGTIVPVRENVTALVGGSEDVAVVQGQRNDEEGSSSGLTTTTYSEYETTIRNGIPTTIVTNTTTITDSKGNILDTKVRKGLSDHHFTSNLEGTRTQSGSSGNSNIERSGQITTTHSRYETKIINGMPITTVTNTTTISDAITGKIISTETVSGGSFKQVIDPSQLQYGSNGFSQHSVNQFSSHQVNQSTGGQQNGNILHQAQILNMGGSPNRRTEIFEHERGGYEQHLGGSNTNTQYSGESNTNRQYSMEHFQKQSDEDMLSSPDDEDDSEEDGHSQTGYMDEFGVYHSLHESSNSQGSNNRRPEINNSNGQYDVNRDFREHGLGSAAVNHGFNVHVSDIGNQNTIDGSPNVPRPNANVASFTEEVSLTGTYDPATGKFIPDNKQTQLFNGNSNDRRTSTSNGQKSYKFENNFRSQHHRSESGGVPPVHYNSIERDNVPTEKPSDDYRFIGRRKRYIHEAEMLSLSQCQSTKCYPIRCTVGKLEPDKEVVVALRARVNARALRNITMKLPVTFSSMMAARISKLPYIGVTKKGKIHKFETSTDIAAPPPEIKPDVVPLWIVLLSAIAGTLILLLAVFTLYKLGFFKRNRPSNAPERQPLNRNGYHQGDEAL